MGDESERQFFDDEAARLFDRELLVSPRQIERYKHAKLGPLNTPKDALFARILPLAGKSVLDYGCGHGENSILLAASGARVTGFDISPVSIRKAKQRAILHCLSDRICFEVQRAGDLTYPSHSFDAVVGIAILHHLHSKLPTIFAEISRVLKPGGTACFIEPFANSTAQKVFRRLIPLKTHATPDERQLTYQDLRSMVAYFDPPELHHFYFLERLYRVFGTSVAAPLRKLDYTISQFTSLQHLYGQLLIFARRRHLPANCNSS
jgi:ubiquinone/menaquinone biosynthesis C-methylase UbiE